MGAYQNLSQERAIEKISGPCIILAGAGTGKTFTIVEKIKYLIKNKIYPPEKIVCITFSNEAANNLLSRVRNAIDFELPNEPIIKTFHAFSSALLKKYGKKIGINENFDVLNPDEAKVILHSNLKIQPKECHAYINEIGKAKDLGITIRSLEIYLKENRVPPIENLKEKLEEMQIKNFTLKKEDFKNRNKEDEEEINKISKFLNIRRFLCAWISYEKIKSKENYLDYADLNSNALKLLKEFPEVANEFDYVIVDEFQDTNKVQLEMLFFLAIKQNITIVGDLNQSIYRFRGAYKENFSLFKEHFNVLDNEIYALAKSFRSPNKVLRLANRLISNNYFLKKEFFLIENAKSVEGVSTEVYKLKNNLEEARKCSEIIESEIKSGKKAEQICVIYRTHAQGEIIKRVLELKNIQYFSIKRESLLKSNAIKEVLVYLTILNKIKEQEKGGMREWWSLFYQSGFSEADITEIGKFIRENKDEMLSVKLLSLPDLKLAQEGKINFDSVIKKIKLLLPALDKSLPELAEETFKVLGFIKNESPNKKENMLNLSRFHELITNFSKRSQNNLSYFLSYIKILERLDIRIESAEIEKEGVRLMSAHATKGLEFDIVILTNLAEKRFPIEKTNSNPLIPLELFPEIKGALEKLSETQKKQFIEEYERQNQLFDERRLCYVALTRTKEKLYITFAETYGEKKHRHSIFLEEIGLTSNSDVNLTIDNEEKFKEIVKEKNESAPQNEIQQKNLSPDKEKTFSPTALLTFSECQKKFEYSYVFNMPEKEVDSWESIQLGSFVHLILEQGIKKNFKTLKEFLDLAKELHSQEEWQSLELEEGLFLIKVFYERNKSKFNERSLTEYPLFFKIESLNFVGVADRIDFTPEGLEIIDYKTGKTKISPLHRNWQLGYYALAASKLGKVRKVTLEMLKQEKPLEFEIDESGNALEQYSERIAFNVNEVKEELAETTKQILEAYKSGFKPCPTEKNCEFCKEYVYNKK